MVHGKISTLFQCPLALVESGPCLGGWEGQAPNKCILRHTRCQFPTSRALDALRPFIPKDAPGPGKEAGHCGDWAGGGGGRSLDRMVLDKPRLPGPKERHSNNQPLNCWAALSKSPLSLGLLISNIKLDTGFPKIPSSPLLLNPRFSKTSQRK